METDSKTPAAPHPKPAETDPMLSLLATLVDSSDDAIVGRTPHRHLLDRARHHGKKES